jgi:GSH-dependent disulfide-bond oxidoreductase
MTIFLEEARLPYKIISVNISKGEQFKPDFLAISPNSRIPVIIDHNRGDVGRSQGDENVSVTFDP